MKLVATIIISALLTLIYSITVFLTSISPGWLDPCVITAMLTIVIYYFVKDEKI